MGMEILWFRHFSILLGEFRAVFSLLLAIILLGIGAGSLAGGYVQRRTSRSRADPDRSSRACSSPRRSWDLAIGRCTADQRRVALVRRPSRGAASVSGASRAFAELWFNARPILLVAGLPALLMGFAFPLANAIIQRAEASVGRRAGTLYLANTFGAVCGSLATGFLLLPTLGIQTERDRADDRGGARPSFRLRRSAESAADPRLDRSLAALGGRRLRGFAAVALGVAGCSLPSDYVLSRALLFPPQRAYTVSEGITELIAVTDGPDGGRVLVTNGHPMSSTELLSQRYMRAMAHIPLLAIDNPERVLVIGFGVGNTARAATLHPSMRRVEVVDLSRHVLEHSCYFKDVNGDVLHDPRVTVLHQRRPASPADAAGRDRSYDLITLEPPPIVHAGVAALYTTEFYELARTRLKPRGYISQWLPAFGVPQSMILVDGSLVCRRVPERRAAVGRFVEPAC